MTLAKRAFRLIKRNIVTRAGKQLLLRYIVSLTGLAYPWLIVYKAVPRFLKPLPLAVCRLLVGYKVRAAKEMLFLFKEAMEQANIDYWLEYGTLLGAVRNGKFIETDFVLRRFDLDMGVFYHDNSLEVIEKALTAVGFKKKQTYSFIDNDRSVEQSYFYKGCKLDVFCFFVDQEQSQMYSHYFSGKANEICTVYRQSFPLATAFETIDLYGRSFRIPADVAEHLAYYYGPGYLTPDTNWSVYEGQAFTLTERKGRCEAH